MIHSPKCKMKNGIDPQQNEKCKIADELLEDIGNLLGTIAHFEALANEAMKMVTERYEEQLAPLKEDLKAQEKALIALMKKERKTFFDGTDVFRLEHGTLIREAGDRVSIPRDALAKCEELKFDDVIKIVKSLDREAVEKWPDEKLFLIGAERKPKEEFKYDLKDTEAQRKEQ